MLNKTNNTYSTKLVRWIGVLLLGAFILTACAAPATTTAAPDSAAQAAVTPTPLPPTAVPLPEAEINIAADPQFGQILVGNGGLTLYIFTKDEPNQSNCDASCLEKWPALITQGDPILGEGVDASLVGSALLADGSRIVTYNHMPLYYWHKDTRPGDTDGQAVGSVWYVLNPGGIAVETSLEASIDIASDPQLGPILVGTNGMTLYIFTKDTPDHSNCDAACLEKWPVLITLGQPVLGPGVDDSKVGTASLPDGSRIATYDHMPLYYFAKDTQPGDVKGQAVGDVWYVLDPDGKILGMEPAADKSKQSSSSDSSSKDDTGYSNDYADSTNPAAPSGQAVLNVAVDPTLGQILVGENGLTLYILTKDTPDHSSCDAACLEKWPALVTQGQPVLGPGVDDSKVGTALLPDGSTIVTYNHMPLYYFVKDTQPGHINGQAVGSVWYVIDPDGDIIGQ